MVKALRYRRERHRHGRRTRAGIVTGATLICALLSLALIAPVAAPLHTALSPLHVDLSAANLPPGSAQHWLGTDGLGRDVMAQALWGARSSLIVGLFAAGIAVTIGSLWGALSAIAGGIVDSVMMRAVDGMLSIPSIILLLAINSFMTSPHLIEHVPSFLLEPLRITSYSSGLVPLFTVIVVISATTWLEAARIARARIQVIKSEEYVSAARSIGGGVARLLFRHLLPNAAPVLLVEAALLVSDAVLMEAGLSYLGLGLGPSTPSWGGMLTSAQNSLIQGNWWCVFVPGFLITSTVAAVTLFGEGLLKASGGKDSLAA